MLLIMTRESNSRWRVIARERYVGCDIPQVEYVIGSCLN
jgi:hypothetical protein